MQRPQTPYHAISMFCVLLFVLLQFNSNVYAQKSIPERIDKIVTQAMAQEEYPGMAVAVIQGDKVLFQKSYGVKSNSKKEPVNDNTIFSIGSVSKAFTGIAIMTLVQQGKISLDDPIKKYLKSLPKSWGDISIKQYMTHTSGIPNVKGEKDKGSFEETVKGAAKLPMAFTPGQKQQYNNFNFAILGKLIESVSGMGYLEYMNKVIFKPLQMTRTGVKPSSNNVAMGHLLKNKGWTELETHFNAGDYGVPSGGLQTTLADFIKLSQALSKNALLNPKSKNTMWASYSPKLSNTPGWHSRMNGDEIIIHKGGGGTGIGSVCDFKIIPGLKVFVIVMANKAQNDLSAESITDNILEKCFYVPKGTGGDVAGEGNER